MQKRYFLLLIIPLLFACKSKPPVIIPEQNPSAELVLEHIEAQSTSKFTLHYRLVAVNPRSIPAAISINDWTGHIDGIELDSGNSELKLDGETPFTIEPASVSEKRMTLELALDKHPAFTDSNGDQYTVNMIVNMDFLYEQQEPLALAVTTETISPRIREPQFTITAIAVLQAELINTRFRVSIKIDNPNVFPVSLSSFSYELYGDGRFWAEGKEKELLDIPALSSGETNIFLIMNFINMRRQLLDDIIALRDVQYRFLGEVTVGTGVPILPGFRMDFERSGNSPVYR